jgi:hypothetical protein
MLTYNTDHPMIPIRPTAVAANDDMGILVWVLGSGRAVPTNYKTLELNEAVLDWFNPSMVYNDVVVAAADEAGGQGFVTEHGRAHRHQQHRRRHLPGALRGRSVPPPGRRPDAGSR